MGKSISHLSDVATQETNTTGVMTPILQLDPDDGTRLRFLKSVPTGDSEGLPFIMDLRDSNDNALPTDTSLLVRVMRPTDDEPVPVTVAEDNIAAWNGLSTKEQRNEENIDAVKVKVKGNVNVRDKDTARIEVNSSKQIDWSNSEFYIVRDGVEELPFEG
ncbi:hypothetical protein ACM16X_04975 [Haloarcula japonica]|uniref:hypothetical protein n=1 Tax=Haloarcula japonica TaxID=29282 RepID=UPI0039F6A45B